MQLQVPVIANVDVLIVGGSLEATALARDLARSGRSVFLATPLAYLADDVCATLDFEERSWPASRIAARDSLGLASGAAPAAIKAACVRALADAAVPFLFQATPVRVARDKRGRVAGALFADRSGFHAVAAKAVVDASTRGLLARDAGVPHLPFEPGRKTLRARVVGGASDGDGALRVRRLPTDSPVGGGEGAKPRPVFLVEGEAEFSAPGPFEAARAETVFRIGFFSPDAVYAPDRIEIDWGDGPAPGFVPSPALPVCVGVPECGAVAVEALLGAIPNAAAPVGFGEIPAPEALPEGCDIVRLDRTTRFADAPTLPFDTSSLPRLGRTGVLVAGGGTAGAPAAIAAARSGAEVVLAEALSRLGGLMTVGRIGKYWFGRQVGFAQEGDRAVYATGDDPVNNDGGWGYNGDWLAQWLLAESARGGRAKVLFGAQVAAALVRRGEDGTAPRVRGAVFATPFGAGWLEADCCIDSTGNADLAAQAGAPLLGSLDKEPAVQGAGGSPVQLGRSHTNNDSTFVVDSDVLDATRAFATAQVKFADSAFDAAPILGTRERRRIHGDAVLHPVDFFAGRTWQDTICTAKSNFDTHGYTLSPLFLVQPPAKDPREADVPLRALLPQGLEGVLVTGLAISADRDAMPLVRMQADVQNQGFAAGLLAASSAAAGGAPLRETDIRAAQRKLVSEGCLPERVLAEGDSVPPVPQSDPSAAAAGLFADPTAALPALRARLAADPDDLAAAQTLAFLGDGSGRKTLLRSLDAPFDQGWNYRGMGQFGASASPQDTSLFALGAIGDDSATTLRKLAQLRPDSEFSHVRAVCMALVRKPDGAARPALEALLAAPGASGHAITTMAEALAAIRPEWNDTAQRNDQLRELYLARALLAVAPDSATARATLEKYRDGLQAAFAPFAAAGLPK